MNMSIEEKTLSIKRRIAEFKLKYKAKLDKLLEGEVPPNYLNGTSDRKKDNSSS